MYWEEVEKDDLLWFHVTDGSSGVSSIHLWPPPAAAAAAVFLLPRSGPSGRSRDGGLSAELKQGAGAPILPDGAFEKKGGRTMLFYHVRYACPLKGPTLS